MIFELDGSLRNFSDKHKIVGMLIKMGEKSHSIVMPDYMYSEVMSWLENRDYCSSSDYDLLTKNNSFWDPPKDIQGFCTKVVVGTNPDTHLPVERVNEILDYPSLVFVENGIYDWAALTQWVKIKCGGRQHKSVNKFVQKAIQDKRLDNFHCGGTNQIVDFVKQRQHAWWPTTIHLKGMVVLDSDKTSLADPPKHTDIEKGLAALGVTCHVLYKRELENYFPWECYYNCGIASKVRPEIYPEEYDFIDIQYHPSFSYAKAQMINLSRCLTLAQLENRLKHHLNPLKMDEVQEIIYKFAKII